MTLSRPECHQRTQNKNFPSNPVSKVCNNLWNVADALHNPTSILVNLYNPACVVKADFSLVSGSNWICQYPEHESIVKKYLVPGKVSRMSSILRSGYTSFLSLHSLACSPHRNTYCHLSLVPAQWDLPMYLMKVESLSFQVHVYHWQVEIYFFYDKKVFFEVVALLVDGLQYWSSELPVMFVLAQTHPKQIDHLHQAKPSRSPSLDLCSSLLLWGQLATQAASTVASVLICVQHLLLQHHSGQWLFVAVLKLVHSLNWSVCLQPVHQLAQQFQLHHQLSHLNSWIPCSAMIQGFFHWEPLLAVLLVH